MARFVRAPCEHWARLCHWPKTFERRGASMTSMVNLRLALRTLFRTPFVTSVAVLSLALGIGGNAAIFSLFHQMLLRAMPVQAPGRAGQPLRAGPEARLATRATRPATASRSSATAMFRDLERAAGRSPAIAAHRLVRREPRLQGSDVERGRRARLRQLLPCARAPPALGRLLSPADDRDDRRVTGRRAQPRLLADALRRAIPTCSTTTLIVNGQTMTVVGVAPRGFDGTTLGSRPQVFVPITMRGLMEPGFNGVRQPALVLGVPVRATEARRVDRAGRDGASTSPTARIINDVEAPLQQGMSDADDGALQAQDVVVEEGSAGRAPCAGSQGAAARAAVRHWCRAAHRVREHRQPACSRGRRRARARWPSVSRSARAAGSWSGSCSPSRACSRCSAGWRASSLPGGRSISSCRCCRPMRPRRSTRRFESARGALCRRADARHGSALRSVSGLPQHAARPAVDAQRPDRAAVGRSVRSPVPDALVTTQIAMSMALLVSAGLFTKSLFNVSRAWSSVSRSTTS